MSPFVVTVISIMALQFILMSLASFLIYSLNADDLDTFSQQEMSPTAVIHA